MAVVSKINEHEDEHRDRGSDTLTNIPRPHFGEQSGQILADALRGAEKDSPAEKALIVALDIIAREHSAAAPGGSGDGSGPSQRFFVRLAGALFAFLAVVQPTASSLVDRYISPSSAIERKLDDVLVQHVQLVEDNRGLQASMISFVRWTVDVEEARRKGTSMPPVPAAVRFMLAQDDLARTTGP